MKKILRVEMQSDGSVWHVDCVPIAGRRATDIIDTEISFLEDPDKYNVAWEKEYRDGYESAGLLINYAIHHLEWEEIKMYAQRIQKPIPVPNYERDWHSAEFSVLTIKNGTVISVED
jgi:hypothetical protein